MNPFWHIRRARDNRLLVRANDLMELLAKFNVDCGRPAGTWAVYFGDVQHGLFTR